ncbi:MAG: NnrS family protein, partial [Pseudomonadota bacterium]|nr:NnrS family protein [Pseudomonadota bacterium]
MNVSSEPARLPLAALSRQLAAAPHRLLFFAGASAVIVSMLWWALMLGAMRFGWGFMPMPSVPPGWAHAMLTQYGMLPMFMFGFLLTVFPRWMNQPALSRRHYVPVALGVFGGYLLANLGLLGMPSVLKIGFALMLAGYIAGLYALGSVLLRDRVRDWHALSCWAALTLGALGLSAFLAFLFGAPASWGWFAVELGTFGMLLPVFFTVCHRMLPFFSSSVATDYAMRRPAWSLPLVWGLLLAHLTLDLRGLTAWSWLVDVPLAVVFAAHALMWQPWKCMKPGLLAVLHLSFAWLPLAFALYAAQSIVLFVSGAFVLGRAPLHVLAIGFFGSMLVAMVTRVTQGHSGRPLQMGAVAWLCFALLQIVVLLRVRAELG